MEIADLTIKKINRTLTPDKFRELRDIVYSNSGIFFPEGKLYLLEGRLNKRLDELNLDSFDDYIIYLKRHAHTSNEFSNIYNLITINETFFFRYENQLNVFVSQLLPELINQRKKLGNRTIKIWSAGCSSGEEPYTLVMMLRENFNGELFGFNIDITGTDISNRILEKARSGIYTKNSFRTNFNAYYKMKYFTPKDQDLEINPDIKNSIKLEYLNLSDSVKIRQKRGVDFIFCRNVLIYFDIAMKKNVVRSFYDVLNHGGYLFLGEAESLHGISSAFKVEHFKGAFAYKKE